MNIRTKLRIAIVIAIGVAVLVSVVLVATFRHSYEDMARVETMDDLVRGVFDLRALTADYRTHGLDRARQQWLGKHASLSTLTGRMNMNHGPESEMVARIDEQLGALASMFDRLAAIPLSPGTSAEDATIADEGRIRLVVQMDVALRSMLSSAHRLYEMIYDRMKRSQRRVTSAVFSSTLLLVLLLMLAAFLITHDVIYPLYRLRRSTEIIGSGNLEHRVGDGMTNEMGELSRAFDRMTSRLRTTMASRDELTREVAERKRAEARLEITLANLERSNKALEQFAYVASHDLQEPIRKIIAFGELLREESGEALNDESRDFMKRMLNAAARMQLLIGDLLDLSRVTSRGGKFVPTDLNGTLQDVVSDLHQRIEQSKGKVEADKLPTIDADPVQMHQLMQNLVGNALKFRREDVDPVVRVRNLSPEVDENGFCKIAVEDNGIGFEEKFAERIFGVFQRLHGRGTYEGCGIGLAICRRICQRHGGDLVAEGRLNEGARFTAALPISHDTDNDDDANQEEAS